MSTIVCTLFESHYHFGVAALVNSICKQGFKGDVYAGYFGSLPGWAIDAEPNYDIKWHGASTLKVSDLVNLHFLPLITDYHLANYKPDFMLELLDHVDVDAQNIFYFDPDIVLCHSWSFFEEWVEYGIAVCEDINSPLDRFHPRRMAWREYFKNTDIKLKANQFFYANSGFLGLNIQNKNFLNLWCDVQLMIGKSIGGLSRSPFPGKGYLSEENRSEYAPFSRTDQDALNVAIESTDHVVSFIGQEGMAFKHGTKIMTHALGRPKPWHWEPFKQILNGVAPRTVDTYYWAAASGPINIYSTRRLKYQRLANTIAKAIGRFYRRQ